MAVGFPPGVAPKDERVVATGMVRTMVLVPVVMAPRLCMGVGNFTLVACGTHNPGDQKLLPNSHVQAWHAHSMLLKTAMY